MTYEAPQWLFWLLLFLGLSIATVLTYHELRTQKLSLENSLDNKAKRREIREALSRFMEEALDLMRKCGNEKEPPPDEDAEALGDRISIFLRDNIGEEYITRMNSGAGLPIAMNSISSIPHRNLWGMLNRWMARLDQFIAEFKE